MTLAGSTSDQAKASRADREHSSMARRNRAGVAVANEFGVYHYVQRVVCRALLSGGRSPLGQLLRLLQNPDSGPLGLAGLLGVEIAAFAVMSNWLHCVDLNPISTRLADRPETSEPTSAHEPIMALCCYQRSHLNSGATEQLDTRTPPDSFPDRLLLISRTDLISLRDICRLHPERAPLWETTRYHLGGCSVSCWTTLMDQASRLGWLASVS